MGGYVEDKSESGENIEREPSERILAERATRLKKSLRRIFLDKKMICIVGLILIIVFGAFIRTRNLSLLEQNNDYPLALDPHYFLRMARTINEQGELPANDELRYYPLGSDPFRENNFLSYTMVYLYKFLHFFDRSITLEKAVILHPVVFFILGLGVFYFLVREIFDDYIALAASFLLATIPAYLYRTMAGFADKEAMGMFFMFLSFFLYIKAVKEKKNMVSFGYAFFAGVTTGLMGLGWGGFKFSLLIIAGFNLIMFLLGRANKRITINYVLWAVPFTVIDSLFVGKYGGFKGLISSSTSGVVYLVLGILVIGYFLRKIKIISKIKLPNSVTTIIVLVVLGSILTYFVIGQAALYDLFIDAKGMLLRGITNSRLGLTVAENKQPFFSDWFGTFGWMFWLFFIGVISLFYLLIKPLKKKMGVLTFMFFLFISGMIFSRISSNSILNGETTIANLVFFGSAALFVIYLGWIYFYNYYKDKETFQGFMALEMKMIFLFMWLIVVILAARGGIRLLMILAPVVTIVTGFLIIKSIIYVIDMPDKFYRIITGILIIIIVAPLIYANSASSLRSATYTGPSYNMQWQKSMDWVRGNTPTDAVFAHWWDYGYWVQTGGERATITDGGNFIPYWNHLMGRHVLSARNETEALEFLYAHGATNLLIISDEIGKYTAYSSIGSDENFDIFSWISTFVMDPRSTTEENNTFEYFFRGGSALDENFVYDGKVYPQKEAIIAGFIVPVKEDEEEEEFEIMQPKSILFYRGERKEVPVECVYHENKKIFFEKQGLQGCLRIFPRYLSNRYQQENGALLYVSRKGLNALWARLFLFDEESENFELVYDDSSFNQLAYYNGRVLGPLKIWRVHYPKDFEISEELEEEYLAETTPEWMRLEGITI